MTDSHTSESTPKRRRRGRGEGSIYQRQSDGLWVGTVELGWQDGKRNRRTVYGHTKEDVKRKVRTLTADRDRGLPVQSQRRTVADYLEQWLANRAGGDLAPNSLRRDRYIVRSYLIPHLGKHRLAALTQHHVRRMTDAMQAGGASARTAGHARATLRNALNDAIRDDLIARNVAQLAKPPRIEAHERPALTVAEALRLIAAVPERWRPLFTLAVWLGPRQAELLGLRWQDIDLDAGTFTLRLQLQAIKPDDPTRAGALRLMPRWTLAPLKTPRSRRTLAIPAPVLATLKAHRTAQLTERLFAGGRWHDLDLVFTSTIGTPVDPANLRKIHRQAVKDAGLPEGLHFHDLRHSASSIMSALGIPPGTVQAMLGHTNISTTMDVYTRGTSDALHAAAVTLAGILDKASS